MSYRTEVSFYRWGIPEGVKLAERNAALLPPRDAQPVMLSSPLIFQSGAAQNVGVLFFEVPLGRTLVITRVSLKMFPQFQNIFPQAYWSALVDGTPIAQESGSIYGDFSQERQTQLYLPPKFQAVQWTAPGGTNFNLAFTVPLGNGNLFYCYAVAQGYTFTNQGDPTA